MAVVTNPQSLRLGAQRFGSTVGELREQAKRIERIAAALTGEVQGWKGKGAASFSESAREVQNDLLTAAGAFERVAAVLNRLAEQLEQVMQLRRQADLVQRQIDSLEQELWGAEDEHKPSIRHRISRLVDRRQQLLWEADSIERRADGTASSEFQAIAGMVNRLHVSWSAQQEAIGKAILRGDLAAAVRLIRELRNGQSADGAKPLPMGSARQGQVNELLRQAKVRWWEAMVNLNRTKMEEAREIGAALRKEMGAEESEEAKNLDVQNKAILDAKYEYWVAFFQLDSAAMKEAQAKMKAGLEAGGTIPDSDTTLDVLNLAIAYAKISWWMGKGNLELEKEASKRGVELRKRAEEAGGKAYVIGLERTALDEQLQKLYEAKKAWWYARAAGADTSAAEKMGREAREALKAVGLDAPDSFFLDEQNEKVLANVNTIKEYIANGEIEAARRLLSETQQLLDQGATLDPSDWVKIPDQGGNVTYKQYQISLNEAIEIQMRLSPQADHGRWVHATRDEVARYLDPSRYADDPVQKYQFVKLSGSNGVTVAEMRDYLKGQGVLDGMENVFLAAARKYDVSEIYLAAHAREETGNGTSELATGVMYKGVMVYNMFGIGATDDDPVAKGAKYAYEQGWTSVEKAIEGGAKWISEHYIHSKYEQDTLYKMRWNPDTPGHHQYATDVRWAYNNAANMKKLFESFRGGTVHFEIPQYSR
jgi:beta-N-acetylglucosaminidase/uncharacterized protein YukE